MTIYIPQHLRNIGVIKQMMEMITVYSKYWYEDSGSSFDDYTYCLKLDPVRRFLDLCYNTGYIKLGENQTEEAVISYLSAMFYSVKGTLRVFDYIERYLGLDFGYDRNKVEETYTTKYVNITFKELNVTDEVKFYTYFRDFLGCLLYFEEFRTSAITVNLKISNTIENHLSLGVIPYIRTEI